MSYSLIKRKILLEDSIDRSFNSKNWGTITADTFYINVFLTQTIDNMGLFTDIEYFSADTDNPISVDYSVLENKLKENGYSFPFMSNSFVYPKTGLTNSELVVLRLPSESESNFYNYVNLPITGYTDSKIEDLKSYDQSNRYKIGFDMKSETYINYLGTNVNGVSRIVSNSEPKKYVFDTENNSLIGTDNQISGLQYVDYTGETRNIKIDGVSTRIPLTNFRYLGEGYNETNVSLSALTKEEYLFGIISKPEIKNDVFIDRGVTSVIDTHLRLSEIKNLKQLERYGNGLYKITKQ